MLLTTNIILIDSCAVVASDDIIFCHIIVNVHDSNINICVGDFSLIRLHFIPTEHSVG